MQSFCRASELCGVTSSDQTQKPVQLLNGKVYIIQTVLTLVQEHTVYLFLPNWSIFCKAEMRVLGDFFAYLSAAWLVFTELLFTSL